MHLTFTVGFTFITILPICLASQNYIGHNIETVLFTKTINLLSGLGCNEVLLLHYSTSFLF